MAPSKEWPRRSAPACAHPQPPESPGAVTYVVVAVVHFCLLCRYHFAFANFQNVTKIRKKSYNIPYLN
jgi:hypothetical protein